MQMDYWAVVGFSQQPKTVFLFKFRLSRCVCNIAHRASSLAILCSVHQTRLSSSAIADVRCKQAYSMKISMFHPNVHLAPSPFFRQHLVPCCVPFGVSLADNNVSCTCRRHQTVLRWQDSDAPGKFSRRRGRHLCIENQTCLTVEGTNWTRCASSNLPLWANPSDKCPLAHTLPLNRVWDAAVSLLSSDCDLLKSLFSVDV